MILLLSDSEVYVKELSDFKVYNVESTAGADDASVEVPKLHNIKLLYTCTHYDYFDEYFFAYYFAACRNHRKLKELV